MSELTTVTELVPAWKLPIKYNVTDAAIEQLQRDFGGLTIADAEDKANFNKVHAARMKVRAIRLATEDTRKKLKGPVVDHGKLIDEEAKRITGLLAPIESHLQKQEDSYNAELARIKREADQAKQRALQARLDRLAEIGVMMNPLIVGQMDDVDFAELLKERTEQFQREKEEADRLAAEQKQKQDAEAEAQRLETERLAEERRQFDLERQQFLEEQRQLKEEKDRLAEERRVQQEAEREKQDAIKPHQEPEAAQENVVTNLLNVPVTSVRGELPQDARLSPDKEKLLAIADQCSRLVDNVQMSTDEGKACLEKIRRLLILRANAIRDEVNHSL